jgi:hypothetical protein
MGVNTIRESNVSKDKTHYRKAFHSPYLSSADIVGPTPLKIARVVLEKDKTKKTQDHFNTAYFADKFIRPGEELKPMILNAHNSKIMRELAGSHFIDDWNDIMVTVYVDPNVRFGKDTVEGLRISPQIGTTKQPLTPELANVWKNAKAAYVRDGNLEAVLMRYTLTPVFEAQLIAECKA